MIKTIFISIGVVLVLVFFSLVILQARHRQEVRQIEQLLQSQPTQQRFTKDMVAELPEPV